MSSSSEEQKTPRRRVRQRARRGAVSTEEQTPKKAVRKRVSAKAESAPSARTRTRTRTKTSAEPVKKREVSEEVAEKVATEKRKAPTPFASSKVNQARLRKRNIILAVVMVIGIGSSAAVGVTDSGQINVNETIEARNERLRNNTTSEADVENSVVSVPVQNTNNQLPNGGLVGRGSASAPPPPPPTPEPVSTSTATSSDEIATSTDEVIEEELETTDEQTEEVMEEVEVLEDSEGETAPETPAEEAI